MKFTFNNISSESLGLIASKSNHRSKPAKQIELIEVPGRTGNLVIDNGTFKSLTIELVCYVDTRKNNNLHVVANQLHNWLQKPIGYQSLEFDDGLKFNAICTNQINFDAVIKNFNKFIIQFDASEVID